MIVQTTRIEYKYGDEFYLKPFFDVHIGSFSCDLRHFKKDISSLPPNTYMLFGGDLYDSITPTDPRYQKSSDKTSSMAVLDEQVNTGISILEPYKNQILGIGLGNHEFTALKRYGTNLIQRTCDALEVPNLGYGGMHRLVFREKGGRGRTVLIRWHHGWGGGGRTAGASLTKYSKDVYEWEADIFLYGHDHNKDVKLLPRSALIGNKIVTKNQCLCVCGTYHKTFDEGTIPSYSELKGYPHRSIGGVLIKLKPNATWVDIKATLD